MDFSFKTITQFNDYFKDEITCYRFLETQRWNGITVCPHCATAKKPYSVKARGVFKEMPSYRCSEQACDLPFTVRTGTIFEGSRVEMRKWLQAYYELSISKKGISSVELASRIGVSQKTAWFMNHRLRSMLQDNSPEMLQGDIEIDETYIGGKNINKHRSKKEKQTVTTLGRSTGSKTPVLGILERSGKVKMIVVPNVQGETVLPIIYNTVQLGARIITDSYNVYTNLRKDFKHETVKHLYQNYITHGDKHTNTIEGVWSILKRGIVGTFHNISAKHLQRYCDEFAHRYNNKSSNYADSFLMSIRNFDKNRLKYMDLTAKMAI